jgi:spermidine/putrescine transport system permease protein
VRSLLFAGLATFFAFVLAYPLAYAMAFKAGKWRGVMMICVIAPFFTSFILRTIAWRQILSDEGPVVSVLNFLARAAGRAHHRDLGGGRRGSDLQLPALHGPADLRLARAGGPGSSRPSGDLYANGSRRSGR